MTLESEQTEYFQRDEASGTKKPFSDFASFIITENLDAETSFRFIELLKAFYEISSDHWRPSDCRSIPGFLPETAALAAEMLPGKPQVVAKHWMGKHYWLEIKAKKRLIIDPTGVPSSWKKFDPKDTQPYFGPISKSRGFPRIVYTHGLELTTPLKQISPLK